MIFRAAIVQAGSVPFDIPATLAKVARLTADAAATGARLVVFPEAFVGGYPKGATFGASVGGRSVQGYRDFQRYFDGAIAVPGPHTATLADVAARHQVHLVIGVIERDGGSLYCTVLFFSPQGELLGKHRKVMPTFMERLVWGFGDGATFPVFDTPLGKLGAVICWENYMPLMRMAMYAKGVQIYCMPTADDREYWTSTARHVALEGRCFVLSACQYLTRDAFPDDYDAVQGNAPDTVLMRGGSVIVSPSGDVLAGPVYDQECILSADLDPDEIVRGKFVFDVAGHYSRPDIFSLQVDERAKPPVKTTRDAPAEPPADSVPS